MNVLHSTTPLCEKDMDIALFHQWNSIDWNKTRATVNRLQTRIAKATIEGKWNLVKRLQYLLTHSYHAKLAIGTNCYPEPWKEDTWDRWETMEYAA